MRVSVQAGARAFIRMLGCLVRFAWTERRRPRTPCFAVAVGVG